MLTVRVALRVQPEARETFVAQLAKEHDVPLIDGAPDSAYYESERVGP